jgi:hypothetical protein
MSGLLWDLEAMGLPLHDATFFARGHNVGSGTAVRTLMGQTGTIVNGGTWEKWGIQKTDVNLQRIDLPGNYRWGQDHTTLLICRDLETTGGLQNLFYCGATHGRRDQFNVNGDNVISGYAGSPRWDGQSITGSQGHSWANALTGTAASRRVFAWGREMGGGFPHFMAANTKTTTFTGHIPRTDSNILGVAGNRFSGPEWEVRRAVCVVTAVVVLQRLITASEYRSLYESFIRWVDPSIRDTIQ